MTITDHAYERAKERLGLSLKAFQRLALRALKNGLKHKETTGPLNKYVSGLYEKKGIANNVRIYGEFVYIFDRGTLITVHGIPNELKKVAIKLEHKKAA